MGFEVGDEVFVGEGPAAFLEGNGGDGGVVEATGDGVDAEGVEGEGVAEGDGGRGGGGEDEDGAGGERLLGVEEGGFDTGGELRPGFAGVVVLAEEPGFEDGVVAVVLGGVFGERHFGGDFVVEVEEVELVPAGVGEERGRGGEAGEGVGGGELLAVERTGESGVEGEVEGGEVGAEEEGLGVPERGELVVVVAGPGLAVAEEK